MFGFRVEGVGKKQREAMMRKERGAEDKERDGGEMVRVLEDRRRGVRESAEVEPDASDLERGVKV
jgi:hypothetical protein